MKAELTGDENGPPLSLAGVSPSRTVASNGLTVIAVPMPATHSVVIEAELRIGSRFETRAENGISHFLEHMLYRGTPRHPSSHEQAFAFELLGGTLEAATGVDHGTLTLSVPYENFERALDLFSEVYLDPCMHGIEIEKGIVREEILESLDDAGRQIDPDNLIRETCFGAHPLGFPITGTLEQLERFDEAALRRHHARHYTGSASTVVVAGRLDPDWALRAVEQSFSRLERGLAPEAAAPPPEVSERFRYVRHSASPQTLLRVAFRAPSMRDAEEPATELLMRTLDDGMSTRLYRHICNDRGLCYDVGSAYEAYLDDGIIELSAETSHERAAEVLFEIFQILSRLKREGPDTDELDKAKTRYAWQLRRTLDEPEAAAEFFAQAELYMQGESPELRKQRIFAVTREQVQRAAARVFRRSGLSVVAVGVQDKSAQGRLLDLGEGFD